MSRVAGETFSKLSRSLRGFGFKPSKLAGGVLFTHPSGRPTILLPTYKNHEIVRPIHQLMVRKQLEDAGLIGVGDSVAESRIRPKRVQSFAAKRSAEKKQEVIS